MTAVAPERALKTFQPPREAVVVPEAAPGPRKPSWLPLVALLLVLGWRTFGGWPLVALLAVAILVFITGTNDQVIRSLIPGN